MLGKKRKNQKDNLKILQSKTKNRERIVTNYNYLNKLEKEHSYIFSTGTNKSSRNSIKQMINKLKKQKELNTKLVIETANINLKCNESEIGRKMYKYIMNMNEEKQYFDKTKAYSFKTSSNNQQSNDINIQQNIIFKPNQRMNIIITDNKAYEMVINHFKNKNKKVELNSEVMEDNTQINNKIFDSELESDNEVKSEKEIDLKELFNIKDDDICKYKSINLSDLLKK